MQYWELVGKVVGNVQKNMMKKNYKSLSEKGFDDIDIYKIMGISHVSGIKYKKIMNGTYVEPDKNRKKYEKPGRPYTMEIEEFTEEYNKYSAKKMPDSEIYKKLGLSRSTGKRYKKRCYRIKSNRALIRRKRDYEEKMVNFISLH